MSAKGRVQKQADRLYEGPSTGRFRFIHASDLHLDTPFEGMRQVAPHVADALRDASLEAWDALVDLTIEQEAAFLLLAGDIYDGAERGIRAQLRFLEGLRRLSDHGIQTFIVHGNHDPLDGWSAIREWPDCVTVFRRQEVDSVGVEQGGQRLAMVHGISYATRDVMENLALRFSRGTEPGLHIGLLHCNAGSNPEHAPYSPCSLDDLRRSGMDYWALGHIHKRAVLAKDPWIVYPGNLQGRSPKGSEQGPKGALVVEVEHGAIREPSFVPLDRVRFVQLDASVNETPDLPSLRTNLLREAEALQLQHAGRGLLLRVSLHGRGTIHADLRKGGGAHGLLQDLRDATDEKQPFVWWESLQDGTLPDLDIEAIRSRRDLVAEVLRRADGMAAHPDRLEALLQQFDEPLLRLARRIDLAPGSEERAALLEEAKILALDLLEGGAER